MKVPGRVCFSKLPPHTTFTHFGIVRRGKHSIQERRNRKTHRSRRATRTYMPKRHAGGIRKADICRFGFSDGAGMYKQTAARLRERHLDGITLRNPKYPARDDDIHRSLAKTTNTHATAIHSSEENVCTPSSDKGRGRYLPDQGNRSPWYCSRWSPCTMRRWPP